MNKAKLEELKVKVADAIEERNRQITEIQREIINCQASISANNALMKESEKSENTEGYQEAATKVKMYQDRLARNQADLNKLNATAIIGGIFDEVKQFIDSDSSLSAREEQTEVWEHLKAIREIHETHINYTQELYLFADECKRLIKYIGAISPFTISSTPPVYYEGIDQAERCFRPKG